MPPLMSVNSHQFSGHHPRYTSRKHLRTKVTPDLHLRYSKNGGNLGLVLKDKKWKILHKIICCGDLYTASKVKHHSNIISETFLINYFLQENNQFVIFCYQSLSLFCQTY